jgi:hypothetical protein
MKNKKNQSIDQNTWPVPNSAASMRHILLSGTSPVSQAARSVSITRSG